MTNYIADDTDLVYPKVDRRPVPPGESATKFYRAADWNTLCAAVDDVKANIRSTAFNIKDYGAVGDGVTNDTAAIQAAIDAAGPVRGTALIPPSPTSYKFSELALWPYMRLAGAHMHFSLLERIAGSTGIAIREKTAAEGNTDGATGIWMTDFQLEGNNCVGDGINIGNQNGLLNLSTFAGMRNVSVQRCTGTGIKINSNASRFSYLWAKTCTIGVEFSGAGCVANVVHGLFTEVNTSKHLVVSAPGTTIYGIHIEDDGATGPFIDVTSTDCMLSGVWASLGANTGRVIEQSGNRNIYQDVVLWLNNNTFTHAIYDTVLAAGTGPVISRISEYVSGETATGPARFRVNQSLGRVEGFYGSEGVAKQTGVPVTNEGIHAALVALGLFSA